VAKCTNRPGCRCPVCSGPSERDEQDRLAEEYIEAFRFQTLWDSIKPWDPTFLLIREPFDIRVIVFEMNRRMALNFDDDYALDTDVSL
jgi:hypothetical protein